MLLNFWDQHDFPVELTKVKTCLVEGIKGSTLFYVSPFAQVEFFFSFSHHHLISGFIGWMHHIIHQEDLRELCAVEVHLSLFSISTLKKKPVPTETKATSITLSNHFVQLLIRYSHFKMTMTKTFLDDFDGRKK